MPRLNGYIGFCLGQCIVARLGAFSRWILGAGPARGMRWTAGSLLESWKLEELAGEIAYARRCIMRRLPLARNRR